MKSTFLKFSVVVVLLFVFSQAVISQTIAPTDQKFLRGKEDSLRVYARFMVMDSFTHSRMIADSFFTRILVRALRAKNSFYYPFETVDGISKLYAPDSSFRIFTWNVRIEDGPYFSRQKGAIQLPTKDGSLKLFPLFDVSDDTADPEDSVRTNKNWIGAVYYNILKTEFNGKNYYTLFGLDNNSFMSTKKWIEVLTFNEKKEPVFGSARFFTYANDSVQQKPRYRIAIEYKKDARVLANYIPDLDVILVDHLISETEEPENKWTFVPDGDNEAFKWENGKWVHVNKAFDFKVDMTGADPYMGKPPMGDPLLDSKGGKNEKKLEDKSNKNKTKERDQINNDN
ncbi:MAG: hypothetical protein E6H09_01095 [Bacteroidetes bacterium]|nr:MAG: hypothetical protein E6H09_01095 [Bacteroidota bacterium]